MNISRLIGATAVATMVSVSAQAADLAVPKPVPAPVIVSVYNWTGFYAGLNIGYGFGGEDVVGITRLFTPAGFNPAPQFVGNYGDVAPSGVNGGLQIGYNWQFNGGWVVGVEADIQASALSEDARFFRPFTGTVATDSEVTWYASLRGRLGYAADKALFYVTGGLLVGGVDYDVRVFNNGNGNAIASAFGDSYVGVGYTVGAGLEFAFADRWTAKIEYTYNNLGRETVGNALYRTEATPDWHNVRLGVNYRF